MQGKIKNLIKETLKNLNIETDTIFLEHPVDLSMGDYSTNVAMMLAKNLKENPKEFAEKIAEDLRKRTVLFEDLRTVLEKIEAKNGFINFYLSRKFFTESVEEILNTKNYGQNDILKNKKIMVEYTDPNPFKPFHIGHLMTNAIGESLARIFEYSGAQVLRANYQGDVGLHVAKAIYVMLKNNSVTSSFRTGNTTLSEKANYIGRSYAFGSEVYEKDENAKKEIDVINKKLYSRENIEMNKIYDWGFKVTMGAFEDLYKMLGTKFDYYFLESKMTGDGEKIVRENLGKVFEESDGAVVFKAEKFYPKLHTRVFITRGGLPTYETKELGLTKGKFEVIPDMDLSIVITANEQAEYMKVVAKALLLISPEYESKMKHITHGMMRLSGGKMSSRLGNVITGESLIRGTIKLIGEKMSGRDWGEDEKNRIAEMVGIAAIKYSILRSKVNGDIIYDVDASISVEGDSGPYLQYSYARANSIIEKAKRESILLDFEKAPEEIFEIERLLYRFPEIVDRACTSYEPHHIAGYLVELARAYNSFYGNSIIVNKDDSTSSYKIALTYAFSFVMKNGLHLLGIEAPKKM